MPERRHWYDEALWQGHSAGTKLTPSKQEKRQPLLLRQLPPAAQPLGHFLQRPPLVRLDFAQGHFREADAFGQRLLGQIERFALSPDPVADRTRLVHVRPR